MGDGLELKNKEELKGKVLRLLSVDARMSMQDIANSLKTTKINAYALFNEAVGDYGMKFVPEISIDKLWKWEFIKRARLRTKRGILAEAVDELPATGFSEYIIFIKFIGKEPKDEEIVKAAENSYIPQFVARLKGEYSLMMYAVARSYEDAVQFTDSMEKQLSKYRMLAYTTRIWSSFGFFPMNKKLMDQFDIFDTYKNLLFGLSDAGRNTFTEIGKVFNQGPAQMLYAYDRLARTEILKRVTYFESKPKNSTKVVALLKVQNEKLFEETKINWFAKLIKDYGRTSNECVFVCELPNPKSMMLIADLGGKTRVDKFLAGVRSCIKGIEPSKMLITRVLSGNLGIRDFDMRYTPQYRSLERKGAVPALHAKSIESVVENPNEL